MARQTWHVDKRQIADRIDRLLSKVAGKDKKVNAIAGKALDLSGEAVRLWRRGVNLPRLDNLDPLCQFLATRGIAASPESILFGYHPKDVHIRERIADDGDELDLLRLFRRSSLDGRDHILDAAKAYQAQYPLDSKILRLEGKKKRRTVK